MQPLESCSTRLTFWRRGKPNNEKKGLLWKCLVFSSQPIKQCLVLGSPIRCDLVESGNEVKKVSMEMQYALNECVIYVSARKQRNGCRGSLVGQCLIVKNKIFQNKMQRMIWQQIIKNTVTFKSLYKSRKLNVLAQNQEVLINVFFQSPTLIRFGVILKRSQHFL